MTEEKSKKSRGRPPGWRKVDPFGAKLPAIRIPVELEEWLIKEQKRLGAASLSDVARMKLMEAKRRDEHERDI